MAGLLENVIAAAVPHVGSRRVALTWANGETTLSGFGHLTGKRVFAALADPVFFAGVPVGDRGRSLDWPGDIELCADALWFEAHPGDAPGMREAAEQLAS